MKKVLVLGSTGMLGHAVALYMLEHGFDVTSLSISSFPFGHNFIGDALNKDFLDKVLKNQPYDLVVNAIGILNNACDENPIIAEKLNSELPHYLETFFHNSRTKVITISTDYVFPKASGIFWDNSPIGPFNFYGETKAKGEIKNGKDLTFRTSIIGPDFLGTGNGLFNFFMMNQAKSVHGYTNSLWCGVTTVMFAESCVTALNNQWNGIINLCNNDVISKYDLLLLFKKFSKKEITITPDAGLINRRILKTNHVDVANTIPSYNQMISDMFKWISGHPVVYEKYLNK